jgi:hypothetical protein
MHVGSLVTFSIPELPIGPRSNGQTPNGVITPMPATIATTPSRCSSSDRPLGLCTPWVGFAVLGEARRVLEKVSRANGLHGINYGTVGDVIGGGIAGSNYGTGDDLGATFNHENGHSMGMPHWGDDWYGRQAATDVQKHPYAGTQITSLFESAQFLGKGAEPLGGGYGNSWGYDTVSHSLISPMCPAVNRERQEPMQRGGPRCEVNQVTTHDWFSDYSSLYAFRYAVGYGQPYSGTVPYPRDPLGNANVPFGYPATGGGRLNVIAPNSEQPQLLRWDHTTARYVDVREGVSQGLLDHRHASASNVPVVTIWGSFSTTTPAANTIMPPLRYIGNLMRTWDPNSPADFTSMKSVVSGEAFWWGADLVVRVDYRDGLRRQAVVKVAPRGTDPLNGNSFDMWAVNFPDDRPIARISLFHRPMEVRNSGDTNPRNINFTGSTTTAANYLDGAPIVATRVIPQ